MLALEQTPPGRVARIEGKWDMDKITIGLIAAAAAVGMVAAQDARRSRRQEGTTLDTPSHSVPRGGPGIDPGIAVLRNDHSDDRMAVRSPFKGDNGIVRRPPTPGQNATRPSSTKERCR